MHDESELERLEAALLACVQKAESEINAERFGGRSPSAEDCRAVVGVDRCGRPISQAMELGNVKHAHALACMRDILSELWPGPFSIEQRYRYYSHAHILETVSREEEQRLLDEDCSVTCPGSRPPRWTDYGEKSAYTGWSQKKIYQDALGGTALLFSPQGLRE